MKFLKFTFILVFLFTSCNSQKNMDTKTFIKSEKYKEMISNGYTFGVITKSNVKGDCEYSIKISDSLYYDPVNLSDLYKKDMLEIWFKFTRMRRMNRCEKASPITINEIIKK